MKQILITSWVFLTLSCTLAAQAVAEREAQVGAYLDSIRDYPVALTAFFQQMPKGADLHHHFTGSVYTETYVEHALASNDLYINPTTLEVAEERPRNGRRDWLPMPEWRQQVGDYEAHRQLLRYWSAMDFVPGQVTSYDDFFDTFGRFWVGEGPNFGLEGLMELKARAEAEHVDYIETMLFRVKPLPDIAQAAFYDQLMRATQAARDEVTLDSLFRVLTARFEQLDFSSVVDAHNRRIQGLHEAVFPEGVFHACMFRYQNYAIRNQDPTALFAELYADFLSASRTELVVGVNIVAPEHHPIALGDYWLHMQMFRFLKQQFPQVKSSLHAGELKLGLVAPEDLNWHIRAAVEIAGADRIGHGVDIAHEADPYRLLALLADRNVAVEINLESNAFILGVEGPEHPFMFYYRANVPLVISTDDAGVLRTNLTAQYVRLAQDYPALSYREIKRLVYNGINYSFLNVNSKRTLINKLNQAFQSFETTVIRQW